MEKPKIGPHHFKPTPRKEGEITYCQPCMVCACYDDGCCNIITWDENARPQVLKDVVLVQATEGLLSHFEEKEGVKPAPPAPAPAPTEEDHHVRQ